MSPVVTAADLRQDARARADAAARAAGVQVRQTNSLEELTAVVELIAGVWGRDPASPVITLDLIRAVGHAGGSVAGAFRDDTLVGASVGFLGEHEGSPTLHSHVTGVIQDGRSSGIGFALKQQQRAWALERGIDLITWTFDPLVRRNAYFNLARLGADAARYLPNFYGPMDDDMNRGDESDRLFTAWRLTSDRAIEAAGTRTGEPDVEGLIRSGAVVALREAQDRAPTAGRITGDVVLCGIPEDIVAIRRTHPDAGLAWRHALRGTLGSAIDEGFQVVGFARSGWYVLRRS